MRAKGIFSLYSFIILSFLCLSLLVFDLLIFVHEELRSCLLLKLERNVT